MSRDGQVFDLFDGVATRRYEFESGLLMSIPAQGVSPLGVVDTDNFIDPDGAGPIAAVTFVRLPFRRRGARPNSD